MSRAPFVPLPFDALPERPRRPHPYFEVPSRDVVVDSAPFGRVRIHVRELGEGPPLLLIHGLMTSSYSWRYVMEPLARDHRVIAPDLPGCGRSDRPDAPSYSAAALATFLGELIDALGIDGCLAVGNSLGGYLCVRLALERPAVFERLVNIHSPARPEPRLYALRAGLSLPGLPSALAWTVRRAPERWAHRNVHYWDESLKSREEASEYGAPLASEAGSRAFVRYLRETVDPAGFVSLDRTLRDRLAEGLGFPIPLLLLYARRDPMVSPVNGTHLAARIPDAELTWLDRSSHFAHVDTPEPVLEILREFLTR